MAVRKEKYDLLLTNGCEPYMGKYTMPYSTFYFNDDQTVSKTALRVKLNGLIKIPSTLTAGKQIAINPNVPPKTAMSFPCVTNGGTVRVQVEPSGSITLNQGEAKGYIFLDGISYDTGEEVPEIE